VFAEEVLFVGDVIYLSAIVL